jgi:hypothetical protein
MIDFNIANKPQTSLTSHSIFSKHDEVIEFFILTILTINNEVTRLMIHMQQILFFVNTQKLPFEHLLTNDGKNIP